MAWSDPLSLYCERCGPGLWDEPFNAVSNVAFFTAAGVAFFQWRRAGSRDPASLLLILVVVAIGIGSTIFHTVATRAALIGDIVPIAVFMAGYLVLALRRYLKLGIFLTLAALAGFEIVSFGTPAILPPDLLNGSVSYLPALLMLIALAALLQLQTGASEVAAAHWLWLATGIFIVSLLFRSIDFAVCSYFPVGTHFIWHCLNAAVLYVLLRAAIEWPRRDASRA
ncbi:MAG TPA: hypothetical protein VKT73_02465 [Xanthobacteraceae bacterium]|nr:hypothetical protein [Xanthobacteraceae bacterium]